MTIPRDEIERMAHEVWASEVGYIGPSIERLMRFADRVAAVEREACATACEDLDYPHYENASGAILACAATCRARGAP